MSAGPTILDRLDAVYALALPLTTTAVLAALVRHTDAQGVAWPSIARLAGMLGANERTVRRALDDLEGRGIVERERRRRPDGTLGTYRYAVSLAALGLALVDVEPPDTESGGAPVDDGQPPDRESGSPPDRESAHEGATPEGEPPPARAREPRQPPLVNPIRGEGRRSAGPRAELRAVEPRGPDVEAVDGALALLARAELDAEPPGRVRDPDRWLAAKIAKLRDTDGPELVEVARRRRPATPAELLDARDAERAQAARLGSAAALGRNLAAVIALEDLLADPRLATDAEREAAADAWRAAQEPAAEVAS